MISDGIPRLLPGPISFKISRVIGCMSPKNVCPRDIELKADIPFFATSDAPIMLIKGGSIDRANTEMMNLTVSLEYLIWKPN